jgi:glutamate-1-semialdehyde 2,1-aminomutase
MLRAGLARTAARRGVPLQALGEGPIAQPVFIDPGVRVTADRDLRAADGTKATQLGHELIRRGVFVIPGAKMYISLAHTDADIAATIDRFDDALATL